MNWGVRMSEHNTGDRFAAADQTAAIGTARATTG
jgi:hypothetical protein